MKAEQVKLGQKATLHSNGAGYFIRIHLKNGVFEDYDLVHNDLEITINDPDAYLYSSDAGENLVLDRSPETLGISHKLTKL